MLTEEQLEAIQLIAGGLVVKKGPVAQNGAVRPVTDKDCKELSPARIKTNKDRRVSRRRVKESRGNEPASFQQASCNPVDEEMCAPPPVPAALKSARSQKEIKSDEAWALQNLRCSGDRAYADIANILRILTRHPDFVGRFQFDKPMGKVINRGTIMMGWQIDELSAVIQERFIPEIPPETVQKALMICANRCAVVTDPD